MPVTHYPVPDQESAKRQLTIAEAIYQLRAEREQHANRIDEIDAEEPALIKEYLELQAAQTYALIGKVIELEDPKPEPEPEIDPVEDPAPDTPAEGSETPEAEAEGTSEAEVTDGEEAAETPTDGESGDPAPEQPETAETA